MACLRRLLCVGLILGLAGLGVVAGNQGDRRDLGKIPDQVLDGVNLGAGTAVNRENDSIHRPFSYYPYGLWYRIPVDDGKTAVAGGVHPGALVGSRAAS